MRGLGERWWEDSWREIKKKGEVWGALWERYE
jgi:hypothetical protein